MHFVAASPHAKNAVEVANLLLEAGRLHKSQVASPTNSVFSTPLAARCLISRRA